MRQKRGLSLLEVLIAMTILATVIGYTGLSHLTIRKFLLEQRGYRYVALNLAREVLEFGESGQVFAHCFEFKYYYPPATEQSLPTYFGGAPCETHPAAGIDTTAAGYKLREWYEFIPSNPQPFGGFGLPNEFLGDIKARGLVPGTYPDSVVIHYVAKADTNFYKSFKQTVMVSWKEDDGSTKTEVISGIPLTHVNDQLQVTLEGFTWE